MSKIIKYFFPEKRETGARLGAYGFFIAIPGAILAFTGFENLGYWIGVTGALIGIGGIVLHFFVNWRKIFHINNQ
jgi:hypothetical protein